MPTSIIGFNSKLSLNIPEISFGKEIYLTHNYSVGNPGGASPFLDSILDTNGAGA